MHDTEIHSEMPDHEVEAITTAHSDGTWRAFLKTPGATSGSKSILFFKSLFQRLVLAFSTN